MQWCSDSLKKEHFIPLLYDVCKWETTYKVACFTLMLYLSLHKVLMDFIKWHTQYTHILDLCNWIKGHRARIMRRRVPVAGRARIMRRRLPVAGRARQARGQKSKLCSDLFQRVCTLLQWSRFVLSAWWGPVLGKWLMKNSEAKNRVMRDFGYLRRFALPPPGVAAALGSLQRWTLLLPHAACLLCLLPSVSCLLPLMSWIINAKYMFI